jgi:hypothetical protein
MKLGMISFVEWLDGNKWMLGLHARNVQSWKASKW